MIAATLVLGYGAQAVESGVSQADSQDRTGVSSVLADNQKPTKTTVLLADNQKPTVIVAD
ncbi:hypothetical protein [Streptomyces sp. Caat 7-52]|uniref:hypothetical protein n=1 Tax=Streptomyces sp. Caat 7-52 TaxID=2949637 RepID=UPI00203567D6|nr:hypothetical protein [Streptomyces sp. Caat 7-52]